MKRLKDYLAEGTAPKVTKVKKPKKIMAPQNSSKEELWNSTGDRWSRNAKHPLQVNEALTIDSENSETEVLTEGIMGFVKPIDTIGRMMQLAGVSNYETPVEETTTVENTEKEEVTEVIITEDALTTQLINSNMNGEFKDNPVAAKVAAIGQLMVAAGPLVEQINASADNKVTPDMMNKLKAAVALGAMFITNARTMVNSKTE